MSVHDVNTLKLTDPELQILDYILSQTLDFEDTTIMDKMNLFEADKMVLKHLQDKVVKLT